MVKVEDVSPLINTFTSGQAALFIVYVEVARGQSRTGAGTWEIWTEPLCNLFVVFILLVVVLVFQSVLLMSKLCDKLLTHFSEGTLVHTSHQSVQRSI